MGLRSWSDRLDRRAQEGWRRPFVAPACFTGALVLGLYGLLVAESPASPLTFTAVWCVFGLVSLVVRARDRR